MEFDGSQESVPVNQTLKNRMKHQWKKQKTAHCSVEIPENIRKQRLRLPIYKSKNTLVNMLRRNDCVIIKGDTACGKTTQIPQYILEAGLAGAKAIAITQPRRVAAISVAERVAKETGTVLGEKVGYCIRFEDVTSSDTRIKYVTDGMLLRESISDPLLLSYSWVILDEAHERTVHTDVLFGIIKSAQKCRYDKNLIRLQVIVMSATIEGEKMSKYFNDAPVFHLCGREYAIKIFNSEHEQEDYVAAALSTVFEIHQNADDGDILVFLTGVEEIESVCTETKKIAAHLLAGATMKLKPCVLYAALPSSQQLLALQPSPQNTRKVIFSTNIAETSITIPNIKFVVDSGMVKCKIFNSVGGLDVLKVQKITKAQADQRAGRAGREFDGSCYRLYTLKQYQNFEDFPIPEIQRCSLAGVILQIIAIGIQDLENFDFMDKPSHENMESAIEQLRLLEAVEGDSCNLKLTKHGKTMSLFPLDPRFSKIIIASQNFKCTDEVLTIISLLSVESIFMALPNEKSIEKNIRQKFSTGEGDHVMLLNLYRALRATKFSHAWCMAHQVNYKNVKKSLDIRKQLSQICQKAGIRPSSFRQDTSVLRKCLAAGLFKNSAHLINKKVYKTLSDNHRVFIHPSSTVFHAKPTCCIYTDLVETSKCYMRNISVVDEEWLEELAPEYFKNKKLRNFQLSV